MGDIPEHRLEDATTGNLFHLLRAETAGHEERATLVRHALYQAQGHTFVLDLPVGEVGLLVYPGGERDRERQGWHQDEQDGTAVSVQWPHGFMGLHLPLRCARQHIGARSPGQCHDCCR